MMEPWLQLQAQRAAHQKSAEAVENIRKAWDEKHDQPDEAARFNETYDDVVEVLRKRYIESTGEGQQQQQHAWWFQGNDDLVQEFDGLFSKLKAREADLADIEGRIAKEKQRWYRQSLRGSVIEGAAEKSMGRPAYLSALDVEGAEWSASAERIHKALDDRNTARDPTLEEVLRRLDGLEGNERTEALIDLVFRDAHSLEVPAPCKAAVEGLRDGRALEETMRKLQQGRSDAAGARSRADRHRRALADLKRAKAQHEQNKMAKARSQQRKQEGPRVEAGMYENLPAGTSLEHVKACALCQIFSSLGLGKGFVYTSAAAGRVSEEEEHEAHVSREHQCASGERCVQVTDEDVDMDGNYGSGIVICKECAEDLGRATVYCGSRCAGSDFRRHREDVHLPARRESSRGSVDVDVKHLVYRDEESGDYHADDIERFVWGLGEATERVLEERNPDLAIKSIE